MTQTEQIADIIETWANERAEVARENLRASGSNASYNLSQSIQATNITIEPNKVTIGIMADDYYKFIDRGVRGIGGSKKPMHKNTGEFSFKTPFASKKMIKSIQDWIANKGIPIRQSKSESSSAVIQRAESVASVIARGIKKRGIKATFFWTNTFTEPAFTDLAERITKVVGDKFEIDFEIK